MADKDTSTEEEVLDNQEDEVETGTTEDEKSAEDQDESEEDTESEDSDDESEEDSDEEEDDEDEEEEPEFSKSFKNIKGDTPEEYIPNLEEAYRKSSREGKRLSTEKDDLQKRLDQISAAVANNPDLKKAIEDATGQGAQNPTVDPALQQVRAEQEQRYAQEYDAFVNDHPELEEDDELQTEFLENIALVGESARKKGKPVSMADATKKAWAMMGREDDKKEKIANAAKTSASKPKSATAKKAKPKSESKLTPEQIAHGKKMGLTEEDMLKALGK